MHGGQCHQSYVDASLFFDVDTCYIICLQITYGKISYTWQGLSP